MKKGFPIIIIGDSGYEISEEYIKGAMAMRSGISHHSNPYKEDSKRHFDWDYGHTNEAACEHIRFGADVLLNKGSMSVWIEDKDVPRDEHGVIKAWYKERLEAMKNMAQPDKKVDHSAIERADRVGKILASIDPLGLVFEWVKTGHVNKSQFKDLVGVCCLKQEQEQRAESTSDKKTSETPKRKMKS